MKKIINVILTIVAMCLVIVLFVSLSIRTMSTKTITNAIIEKEVNDNLKEVLSSSFPEISSQNIDTIEEVITENDTLNEVAGNLLDQVSTYISNGQELDTTAILNEVSQAVDQTIPELENAIGQQISKEQITEIKDKLADENGSLKNKINETVDKIQNASPKTTQFIKIYNTLDNNFTKIICGAGLIIIVILLGIINRSYYKWMLYFSSALVISGIIVGLFLPLVVNALEFTIGSRLLAMSIDIPVSSLNYAGIISGVIGIVLGILYLILKRKYPGYSRHYY